MGTRRWHWYEEPGLDGIKLGKFASGNYTRNLAKACCANYAECRRNVLCFTVNVDNNNIVPTPDSGGDWKRWLWCPIGGRIVGPGTLKVWILALASQEGSANDVYVQTKIGPDISEDTMTLDASDPAWTEITLTMTQNYNSTTPLEISFKTESNTTITIYSVSAYQTGDSNAPSFTDVSSGHLGTNDGPCDVFAMKLLRDNVCAVRGWKVPRANVFNHWYHQGGTSDASYSTNKNRLGAFKFVKRKGINELKMHFWAGIDTGFGTVKVRTEITGLNGAPTEGADQETTITGGLADPEWHTVTWTLHSSDQDVEVECELIIDGKSSSTDYLWFGGFALIETDPDTSHTHTNPDPPDFKMGKSILASQHEAIWDTCHHLWNYGGRQILASDWYQPLESSGNWSSTCYCDHTSAGDDTDFDKRNWWGSGSSITDETRIVIARALLFSSTGSSRLRVRMGYHTTSGTDYTKTIHICTSETVDTTHCTHIDSNPFYDDDSDGDHDFTDEFDGLDSRPAMTVEHCYLDIRTADQEEQTVSPEPPQVFIQAKTTNASEYIIPDWISIEEVELGQHEFP